MAKFYKLTDGSYVNISTITDIMTFGSTVKLVRNTRSDIDLSCKTDEEALSMRDCIAAEMNALDDQALMLATIKSTYSWGSEGEILPVALDSNGIIKMNIVDSHANQISTQNIESLLQQILSNIYMIASKP
jgi:hypothetical protein